MTVEESLNEFQTVGVNFDNPKFQILVRLTLDISGATRQAKPAVARPLDEGLSIIVGLRRDVQRARKGVVIVQRVGRVMLIRKSDFVLLADLHV